MVEHTFPQVLVSLLHWEQMVFFFMPHVAE